MLAWTKLSSVDIIDTAPPHNNNNNSNGEPTIVAGPSMNLVRSSFGAAVVDNRIFVIGGNVNSEQSTSVESLLLQEEPQDKDHTNSNRNASCMFPNSSWRMEPHLSLSGPRILLLWQRWDHVLLLQEVVPFLVCGELWKCWMSIGALSGVFPI